MKISKIAIALAASLAISSFSALPSTAQGFSVVVTAAPAATIGPNDSVAIDKYKTDNSSYISAVTAFRVAKQNGKGVKGALKSVEKTLKVAVKSYGNAKKVIGKTFSDSVAAAKSTFKTETAAATNAEQKLAAKNKFAESKSQAASNRAAALASLGAGPAKFKK